MQLHYEVRGNGRALIVLHGLFGSLENWRTQARELSRFFTVYTLDLRNHGNSPHSDVMSYPAMAEDLREFLKTHGISSAFVLGHSMGGKVAMQFAMRYPEFVDKLVVVDIAPKDYPPEHKEIIRALLSVNVQELTTRGDVDVALSKKIPDTRVRRFLLKNLVHVDTGGFGWQMNLRAIQKNYGKICRNIEPSPGRGFRKPACFIRGAQSSHLEILDYGKLVNMFSDVGLLTVTKAGHWVHVDNPKEFAEDVIEFLQEKDRRDR